MKSAEQGFGWKSVVFLMIPMFIYFLIVLGDTYKASIPWFRIWHPVVAVVFLVLAASFVQKRLRFRKAGLTPARSGFSGEIDVVLKQLEQRLAEVDSAVRFQRSIAPLPREFQEFTREVVSTALAVDKKQILSSLQSLRERDNRISAYLQDISGQAIQTNEFVDRELESYRHAMNAAIEELREYSEDVRRRGGLYNLSKREFVTSIILIVCFAGTGMLLVWKYWQGRPWQFWAGALSLVIAGIILALLIGTVKDQEQS